MAALLLGCGALVSDRLKQRQRTREEDKKEYASRFEEFKAINEQRELYRQQQRASYSSSLSTPSTLHSETDPATNPIVQTTNPASGTPGPVSMDRPPSYEVVARRTNINSRTPSGRSSRSSTMSCEIPGVRNERTAQPLIEQTKHQRNKAISPSEGIASRDMTTT